MGEESQVKQLEMIKTWMENELTVITRTDDEFITRFMYGCKFNTEKLKYKMKNFDGIKTKCPEWFNDRNPNQLSIRQLLDMGVFCILPDKQENNQTIVIVRAAINNPKLNSMSDVLKVGIMVFDLALELDKDISRHGINVIIDLYGVGLAHAVQMTPNLIKKAVFAMQDCYPVQIKSIDFVNCPVHVNLVLNIFKRFMNEKLKKRIRIHKHDMSTLHKHISYKCLPLEYGGTCLTVKYSMTKWDEAVFKNQEWFIKDGNFTNCPLII